MPTLAKRLVTLGLLSAVVLAGLSASSGTDPIAVIALRPTALPAEIPNPDAAGAMFDSLIIAELTRAGYRVIPPDITAPVWKHVIDSLGGIYNTATGELIAERFLTANVASLAALRAAHGADAILAAAVLIDAVPYDRHGKASWDGVTDRVGVVEWGVARVLTLAALTRDATGRAIHCGRGGIRALQKANVWSGKRRAVQPTEFFSAPERNVGAVRRALASLIAHAPTCDRSSGG